ncbi:MAG TPA: FAD:protein FMN transferase [Opitutus sp.]|nr:FAD:protein FMN transferase [Opitutus sp.]
MALVVQNHRSSAAEVMDSAGALRRVTFRAMGTKCEIQYACDDLQRAAAFERTAVGWVQAFEAKYSRFRDDSLIGRINAAAGREWIDIDADMEQMLKLCDTLFFLTQGILDPTALPLLRIWNYKAEHLVLPTESEIAAARRLVGWSKVQRTPGKIFLPETGMALDFGGFGKEYAVDIVAQIAANAGIADVLVDFGHDLRALGKPPGRPAWHVGLEDPKQPGTSAGSVALGGSRGIASSGDYLRQFTHDGKRYGHIIDPRTGRPVANGCLQSTVIAGTCLHAGVLSTTAFVLGVVKGIEFIQMFPGAEGQIMTEHARAQTRGFFNHVVSS